MSTSHKIHHVILHNYEKNELTSLVENFTQTLASFTDLENALFFVEEFVNDYIESLQGDRKFEYLFEPPVFGTTFKEGFYVIKYKEFQNRLKIYRRSRYIGWVMNSQEDIPHFEIFVSSTFPKNVKSISTKKYNVDPCEVERYKMYKMKKHFNLCLKSIDKEFKFVDVDDSDEPEQIPKIEPEQLPSDKVEVGNIIF